MGTFKIHESSSEKWSAGEAGAPRYICGVFSGFEDFNFKASGKPGRVILVADEESEVIRSVVENPNLKRSFRDIAIGASVAIEFTGTVDVNQPSEMKTFRVYEYTPAVDEAALTPAAFRAQLLGVIPKSLGEAPAPKQIGGKKK